MKNCPYCNTAVDFYFKIFSKTYNRCLGCNLTFRCTQETYDEVLTWYRENYFERYSADQMEGRRDKLFEHVLDVIETRKTVGRLLDVGTGSGFFLVAAQKRGWEVKGIDPSTQSAEFARTKNRLDVFNGTLQKYDENDDFDVITFINVLDHSVEPWKEIELAKKLLKSGGLIFIRFPNGFLHTRIFHLAFKFGVASQVRNYLVFQQFSFTPRYIRRLLSDWGFTRIIVFNSPPSEGDPNKLFSNPNFAKRLKRSFYLIAKAIEVISGRKILLGTSLEVVAVKKTSMQNTPNTLSGRVKGYNCEESGLCS
jgi:2-polyprenyl-3-methyl-5-hydroxy-6-metoxy-1,4-benzoquinol methylase